MPESSPPPEKEGHAPKSSASKTKVAIMNFAEAEELEECQSTTPAPILFKAECVCPDTVRQDLERRRKVEAKHDRLREINHAQLSEKERQAKIYAFMYVSRPSFFLPKLTPSSRNAKPSDSDVEDDSDDEDPANWFQDSDDEADKHGANFEPMDDRRNEYTQHAISIAPDA